MYTGRVGWVEEERWNMKHMKYDFRESSVKRFRDLDPETRKNSEQEQQQQQQQQSQQTEN